MARVFTTEFSFHELLYAALVSMQKKGQGGVLEVHLYDTSLYKYIPGGQLVFSGAGVLVKPHDLKDEQAIQLVACISAAISMHFTREPFD